MTIRILLADDHAIFRCGLRVFLEKEDDFTIAGETGDGFETLRFVAEKQVDVVLLDISMPGISGTKVAEEIIAENPQLPIIVLTMHADEYYLQELFKIGVKGFVLKKSSGEELIQAIRAVWRGNTYIDPAMSGYVISSYVGRKPEKKGRVGLLTLREKEVLGLLALGHTNDEVSRMLSISSRTVETHRANIMSKLDLNTRAELVRFAIDNGVLKLDPPVNVT